MRPQFERLTGSLEGGLRGGKNTFHGGRGRDFLGRALKTLNIGGDLRGRLWVRRKKIQDRNASEHQPGGARS